MTDIDDVRDALTYALELEAGATIWYVKRDDLIGGWCIMPIDSTPANAPEGVHSIGDFLHYEDAHKIVTAHNLWSVAFIAPLEAAIEDWELVPSGVGTWTRDHALAISLAVALLAQKNGEQNV